MRNIKLEGMFWSAGDRIFIDEKTDTDTPNVICINDYLKATVEENSNVSVTIDTAVAKDMTRDEMIAFIKSNPGVKITHRFFSSNEYIYSKNNRDVYDELGYLFEDWYSPNSHNGIRIRNGHENIQWETGWSVYSESTSKEEVGPHVNQTPEWIYLAIGHRSFRTGRMLLVPVYDESDYIPTLVDKAKAKAAEYLNLPESEISILDYSFYGEELEFVK